MKRNDLTTFFFLLTLLISAAASLQAQIPRRHHPGEIYQAIQQLNFLGSALYVAAHPDDENTRLIAYLANDVKARTAYLSLTRGDGGQNLIGPEIRELLGVLRTQELLAARRIDGGSQMFTRANDFGYSKTPAETMEIWNREEVLSDVVWAIRKWRPDIIVNRFNHDPNRRTHGHHTASAMLSYEAFDLAGDPSKYPDQLKYTDPWQPARLFFNTSWWFYGSREKFDEADKSRMMSVDIGEYYPLLGLSNTEIASRSRSQHKCQAFGDMPSRGSRMEYLELLKGEMPENDQDLFAGINTSWSRVAGGEKVGAVLKKVEEEFSFEKPAASVPLLMDAYRLLQQLPADDYWVSVKTEELKEVIAACMGLFLEAVADDPTATPGEAVEITLEATNRSEVAAELRGVQITGIDSDTSLQLPLEYNTENKIFRKGVIPQDMPLTNPYWLDKPGELGMYRVDDRRLIGKPETDRPLQAVFELRIDGQLITYVKEVVYKYEDPAKGEVYRPFEITPPVFANFKEDVYLFPGEASRTIPVVVRAGRDGVIGKVSLRHPEGWSVEPEFRSFELTNEGQEHVLEFELSPGSESGKFQISPQVEVEGKTYDRSLTLIAYDHIPTQTIMMPAQAAVTKVDIRTRGERVGYLMGSGDAIPAALREIGYEVDLLEDEDISADRLREYDAVILGIRALNTRERIAFQMPILHRYAQQGGTLILQYNTSWGLNVPMERVAPYSLQISRDRVTKEEAEVRFLAPDHPVLNEPNKITQQDFEGWVQERGLYFPDEWGPEFTPILSANDPGETPKDGGLLVASYGKGHFIYTGYSWFRELPAGVPGAYRLFANLISIGK